MSPCLKLSVTRAVPVLAALAGLASSHLACDDSDPPAPDPAPFIGTWELSAGQLALNCGGFGTMERTLFGAILVSAGRTSHLNMTFSTPELARCTLLLDIAGAAANIRPNQSCPFTYDIVAGSFTTRSGTLILNAQGASLTLAGTLNATFGNITLACEGTMNGTLIRAAAWPDGGGTTDAGEQDARPADTPAGDASSTDTPLADASAHDGAPITPGDGDAQAHD